MPQIELTVPRGTFSDATTDALMADMTTALLRWEGAPVDSPAARDISWGYVHEVDPERTYHGGVNAAVEAPRYRVDLTVPAGALTPEKKNGAVGEITRLILAADGATDDAAAMRVWVLIHEVPDGNWGGAGRTWTLREIAQLVAAGDAAAVPAGGQR